MSTEISLNYIEPSEYLSPEAIPANVPTTGEGTDIIAPWLSEPVCVLPYTFMLGISNPLTSLNNRNQRARGSMGSAPS